MIYKLVFQGGARQAPQSMVSSVPAASLDLATLLALVERCALTESDGHLTIMRFTTGWKCLVETPDLDSGAGRQQVEALPGYPTLCEALVGALLARERPKREARQNGSH